MAIAEKEKDLAQLSLPELRSYYNHLADRKSEISKVLKMYAQKGMTNSSKYNETKKELENLIDILNQVSAWIQRKS